MKIAALVPEAVPYVAGGFERLWHGLVDHLNCETEHDAELVSVQSPESNLPEVVASYRHFSELDLSEYDLVLTSKYPAWMVQHRNHVIYMAHTLRGLYDTYPAHWPHTSTNARAEEVRQHVAGHRDRAGLDDIFASFDVLVAELGDDHPDLAHPSPLGRQLVHTLDNIGMSPGSIRRYLAISATVASRVDYFPDGTMVEVVHPPTSVEPLSRDTGDYFFTASRLDRPKRIDLLIESMAHAPSCKRLLIAGGGPERDHLARLADGDSRIELLGQVSESDLAELYAGAIAVPFVPADEDYGLIALESMASGTAVITCSDSGGPTELVSHRKSGLIASPNARSIGEAIELLAASPHLARNLGAHAAASTSSISWAAASRSLLRRAPRLEPRTAVSRYRGKPRLVILSTFTAHNPRGGGQLRAFHLYRSLTKHFDVDLLSLDFTWNDPWTKTSSPGFTETSVPRSGIHHDLEVAKSEGAGIPVSDIYGGNAIDLTPEYLRKLKGLLRNADAVVLAHPYMYPALPLVEASLPIVYDAHNVETILKDAMIVGSGPQPDSIRAVVREVEAAALQASSLAAICSEEDGRTFRRLYFGTPEFVLAPNGADLAGLAVSTGATRSLSRRRWLEVSGTANSSQRLGLFLGSWHQPNIDAAREIDKMAPELPDTTFLMVGTHCDAMVDDPTPANVLRLGTVSDATKRVLLGAADVGLNPVVTGSGTNLKLVEYLGAGLPTVTTPIGARGLPGSDPPLCTIVELDQFVPALKMILAQTATSGVDDPGPARAAALVRQQYDWSSIGDRLATSILELI